MKACSHGGIGEIRDDARKSIWDVRTKGFPAHSGRVTPSETDQVIAAVLAGRTHEFAKLVREYGLSLRAFVHSRIHHSQDAEDVAQETFVSAFKSLSDFETGRDFGAWLTGIARHRILEHLRARGRRIGAMERFQSEVTGRVESELSACQAAQSNERLERLLGCIERLPARLKLVVRAHLSTVKIPRLAEEMGTTAGAIYNLQWRANRILRDCMEKPL